MVTAACCVHFVLSDCVTILYVSVFSRQQQRLEQIDKTIGLLVTQVKTLLLKLEKMENVKKVKTS